MPHDEQTPLRVCYVVSYFHPFESGAERQALAQGSELARRGHSVHVITKAIPGYPVLDEEHRGVFIHRWINTVSGGPLFALSFVAGIIRALRRLRFDIDLIHTHQALWEAVATGLARPLMRGKPTLVQPASAGYYGEAQELARTRGSGPLNRAILANTAFAAISAEIEREWLALGVSPARIVRIVERSRCRTLPPRSQHRRGPPPPAPSRAFHRPPSSPEKPAPLARGMVGARPDRPGSLILVGPGNDRQALADLAKSLGHRRPRSIHRRSG